MPRHAGDGDRDSRLSHRGLGVFFHVILAQLFLALVPGERKRGGGRRQRGPRRPEGHTDGATVTSRGSAAAERRSDPHPAPRYRCWKLRGRGRSGSGPWGMAWGVWGVGGCGLGFCLAPGKVGGPRGEMGWGGGRRGDLGLPSISSAREEGVAVEDGANNSGKTTRG